MGDGSFTCYTKKELTQMAQAYNRHASAKREHTNTNEEDARIETEHRSKRQIWNALHQRFRAQCNNEFCWTVQPPLRTAGARIARRSFRPAKPSGWTQRPHEWLSNVDILQVLEQYEHAHDDFLFVGPVPIDFEDQRRDNSGQECVSPELCRLNLQNWWNDEIRRVGIVFNLDPHYMSGSHWVSLYADLTRGDVHYYDSYGLPAQDEIRVLMNNLVQQGNRLRGRHGEPFRSTMNTRRHQFKNSECGVYCLHFISQMLEGKDYDEYVTSGMNDRQMNSFRNYFFNPLHHKYSRARDAGQDDDEQRDDKDVAG